MDVDIAVLGGGPGGYTAAGAPAPALPALPAGLTERELEILRWLAAGATERQIAARTGPGAGAKID
jgi:DNA-binding NarL/FixJ family response regulator